MVAAPSILDTPSSALSSARDGDCAAWLEQWGRDGWLCAGLAPKPEIGLAEWLTSSVETELIRLGAVPKPDYVSSAVKPLLQDQLYRARMLGFQGLALLLPSLEPWAQAGVLTAHDSEALFEWCAAARELDVPVRLSTLDGKLRVYRAPVSLDSVETLSYPVVSDPSRPERTSSVREVAESGTECVAPSSPPPSEQPTWVPSATVSAPRVIPSPTLPSRSAEVAIDEAEKAEVEAVALAAPVTSTPVASVSRRAAMRSLLADDDDDSLPDDFGASALPSMARDDLRAPAFATFGKEAQKRGVQPVEAHPPRSLELADQRRADASDVALEPEVKMVATRPEIAPPAPDDAPSMPPATELSEQLAGEAIGEEWAPFVEAKSLMPDPEPVARRQAPRVNPTPLSLDEDNYSHHIEALQAAGGTHGWEDIEQLFESHYLPLQKAVRDGAAPALAASVLAEWAKDFAESYEQAFEAIRSNRGKKPRLVLDVPSYSFQLSRKHNAEHVKMVLVDGMRADVGAIVRDKLRLQMANTAENVVSGLLWSALPATTAAQMELIARGSDGLRHFSGELTEAQLMSRGNDLRRLRPVRVGSHRMYKLDIVQYLAKDVEQHSSDNLEQYAAEVATSVGRFLRQQEANTLVYLFGDHGFGGVTTTAPEQILTPYQAWLIRG